VAAQRKYPEELRERAVKMLSEVQEREGRGHGELALNYGDCPGASFGSLNLLEQERQQGGRHRPDASCGVQD
jgi:hypothetical protein